MKSSSQLSQHHHHQQQHQHQHPYHHPQQRLPKSKQQHHQKQQHKVPTVVNNGLASCDTISEKLGLGPEVRELKLGPTFLSDKTSTAYHTIKYDFKPASVDTSKMATVDVGDNNTMTVTVPHWDGAGVPHTVFKGSQKPYSKECVLIIDNVTGEIILERLSCNIQVKKTRCETKTPSLLSLNSHQGIRPITPIDARKSPTIGRTKSRTKVTSGKRKEPSYQLHSKRSPQQASSHQKSPSVKSPCSNNMNCSISCSAMPSSSQSLASLPVINENDDFSLIVPTLAPTATLSSSLSSLSSTSILTTSHSTAPPRTRFPVISEKPPVKVPLENNVVGILSDSSSSDSSPNSSESESEAEKSSTLKVNGHAANGAKISPPLSMPDVLLNEDLQLSESESDSD
ncbi:ell-associated factor Eaf isoform X2 [Copidosoma floridanum]|uniref:ell-associated factor Eaf isoform X2 n=1 Tax=Copidosoma floridanum TaxID=29053 RepID=UPI0006C990BC|nr:ell-associated factor Eaf isoform X2 [Copidosoma floridanum]